MPCLTVPRRPKALRGHAAVLKHHLHRALHPGVHCQDDSLRAAGECVTRILPCVAQQARTERELKIIFVRNKGEWKACFS